MINNSYYWLADEFVRHCTDDEYCKILDCLMSDIRSDILMKVMEQEENKKFFDYDILEALYYLLELSFGKEYAENAIQEFKETRSVQE